jgi:hypothetical protein
MVENKRLQSTAGEPAQQLLTPRYYRRQVSIWMDSKEATATPGYIKTCPGRNKFLLLGKWEVHSYITNQLPGA